MTLPLWSTVFADNNSVVSAAFLNGYVRTQIPKAIDGVGGGAYSPAAAIEIGGLGLKISNDTVIAYNSRSVPRQLALLADTTSGNWQRAATPRGAWKNTASGGTLDIHLEGLPHNNVLQTLVVRFKGGTGHAAFPGGAPGNMPTMTLRKIDEDGTESTIATATDTSSTAGAYEAAHAITMSSITHTIDRTAYRYVLTLTAETGANFQSDGTVIGIYATCAMTSQSEW